MRTLAANAALARGETLVSLFQRVWPPLFIVGSLGLTAVWVSFIGYIVVRFIIT